MVFLIMKSTFCSEIFVRGSQKVCQHRGDPTLKFRVTYPFYERQLNNICQIDKVLDIYFCFTIELYISYISMSNL